MSQSDSPREMLRREAAGMEISPSFPAAIPRSIRRRRIRLAAIVSVVPIAMAGAFYLLSGSGFLDSNTDVAGEGSGSRKLRAGVTGGAIQTRDPQLVGEGRDFELSWQLVLSRASSGPCLELQVDGRAEICDELNDELAESVNVIPGYSDTPGVAYVFGTVPEGRSVWISLRGGGQWAGLIFEGPEGDGRDYFVRVFPTAEVSGVLAIDGTDKRFAFDVEPRPNGSVDRVRPTKKEGLFELEGLPGDKSVIWTEPVGDMSTNEAYDVVLRTDVEEVCFHIEGSSACDDRPLSDELRLVTAQRVGDGVVIAGLVGPAVEEVVVESFEGDRYPQQLQEISQAGIDSHFFVFEVEGTFEGQLVITNREGSSRTAPLPRD